jgi:endoglucanase
MKPTTVFIIALSAAAAPCAPAAETLSINDQEYLEMAGLNVMLAHDYYPEGHQGGVCVIQNGRRVATNGDLRLEPTPGQWQPIPAVGTRRVDRAAQEISVHMAYPDETKDRKGEEPIAYPDLKLGYTVTVKPSGSSFRIIVDLDQPLPTPWVGRVGLNLELFPGSLFGRSFMIGGRTGVFPRQANGPGSVIDGDYEVDPLGRGPRLTVAPESDLQRLAIEVVRGGELELLDGRANHTDGWFVVRALVPAGATKGAVEWLVTPHAIPGWMSDPVIQVSQVGYYPRQQKIAVIELDRRDTEVRPAALYRVTEGGTELVTEHPARDWGRFLRYHYLQFDFSDVSAPGMYQVRYGGRSSNVFQIDEHVFARGVWQPTIEYFLPVQMAHMRVEDKYRVWHGLSHIDDALMAPVSHDHFDAYAQGPSTLTKYKPGEHVPGLDRGGWFDAGDHDLRIESQVETMHGLALAWELFHPDLDDTTIDQANRIVQIHQPDGKPDILQQIEHGALTVVGGYKALGRLYRGIQDATLHQHTVMGDASTMTDNLVFQDKDGTAMKVLARMAENGDESEPKIGNLPPLGLAGSPDDRWVFTEDDPGHELEASSGLAAASRALRGFNDPLAADCLRIAGELWVNAKAPENSLDRLEPAIELLLSTGEAKYAGAILGLRDMLTSHMDRYGWLGARSLALVRDPAFVKAVREALRDYRARVDALSKLTPYGVPYKPDIWGAGWDIQHFGVHQYFLHAGAPDIFPDTYMLNALEFVLGCHPGPDTSSFVSGVGARSLIPAYGMNRADFSYIPGGVASGTALIRPDFPELADWPFLWQQREYCLGDPTSDYIFLVLAAEHPLKN